MNFVIKTLAIVCVASMLNGCGNGSSDASSASLPSTDPSDGGGEVGEVSSDGIWIGVANNSGLFDVQITKDGIFNTEKNPCKIPGSVTITSQDINCQIDILELDNFFHDVEIQYNIPVDACHYVVVSPSWHWNYSSGFGPAAVTIEKNAAGEIEDVDTSGDGGCRTVQNGIGVSCDAAPEIYEVNSGGATCEYDYTSRDIGPNCCFGTYILTTHKDTNGDGNEDPGEVESETKKWGGLVDSCIGGHTKGDWSNSNKLGYPMSEIFYVEYTGLNNSFKIPSNSQGIVSSFQYGVNYYATSGSPHSHTGFVSASTSTLPYAFAPIDDLDGTPMTTTTERPAPRAPYTVTCLDRGGEIKHRINVYLREWNTINEYAEFLSSLGETGDPDVTGDEGTDCEYENSTHGGLCNDYYDWEDILSATGGSYDMSTPNATTRRDWHPKVDY